MEQARGGAGRAVFVLIVKSDPVFLPLLLEIAPGIKKVAAQV